MTRTSGEVPAEQHNQDRMRRAFSWLKKSRDTANPHEKFIFLWIAFNAAYGAETIGVEGDDRYVSEARRFKRFLREIVRRDEKRKLEGVIWGDLFSGPIRVLLGNQYVFRPFWEFVQGEKTDNEWKGLFQQNNRRVKYALKRSNVDSLLMEIFQRLYTLRNQIFHGGTTFARGWGKSQLRDGSRIMASLVPIILNIMKADIDRNPASEVWGKVAYPRVNHEPDER
ncbi:MAG: HEPN domain-containing protein [Gammaproteobacteria bacterium]|nr:HEPN domain-containing protein [Gammaproteobacteria bacterium]MDD9874866.1 HEPN domain-containing protein [Gammaproteobacteria bacterium]